jgi:hypothetical protein
MIAAFRQFRHFFFARIPPHGLALIRIAFGAYLLALWLRYLPHVDAYFSDRGLLLPYWDFVIPPPLPIAYLLYGVLFLAIAGIIVGAWMRLSIVVAFVILAYFVMLSFHMFFATWGRLSTVVLVLLLFSGADRTFSWRMRRKGGSWTAWESIPAWPLRLLAIQVTFTYAGAALQKSFLPDWQSGGILYGSHIGPWATPIGFWVARLGLPLWFWDINVVLVKIFEGLVPIGLWIPSWRKWIMITGSLFHTGITLIMGMWWFMVLIPLYIAFLPPEDMRKWCERRLRR